MTTETVLPSRNRVTGVLEETEKLPNGIAAAALLASGIGCAALGVFIVLVELSPAIKSALTFNKGVGPLGGKTILAVAVWLVSWVALHVAWRRRELSFGKVWAATLALVGVGLIGTFPPFFQLFTRS
jgi:hypothetical protein